MYNSNKSVARTAFAAMASREPDDPAGLTVVDILEGVEKSMQGTEEKREKRKRRKEKKTIPAPTLEDYMERLIAEGGFSESDEEEEPAAAAAAAAAPQPPPEEPEKKKQTTRKRYRPEATKGQKAVVEQRREKEEEKKKEEEEKKKEEEAQEAFTDYALYKSSYGVPQLKRPMGWVYPNMSTSSMLKVKETADAVVYDVKKHTDNYKLKSGKATLLRDQLEDLSAFYDYLLCVLVAWRAYPDNTNKRGIMPRDEMYRVINEGQLDQPEGMPAKLRSAFGALDGFVALLEKAEVVSQLTYNTKNNIKFVNLEFEEFEEDARYDVRPYKKLHTKLKELTTIESVHDTYKAPKLEVEALKKLTGEEITYALNMLNQGPDHVSYVMARFLGSGRETKDEILKSNEFTESYNEFCEVGHAGTHRYLYKLKLHLYTLALMLRRGLEELEGEKLGPAEKTEDELREHYANEGFKVKDPKDIEDAIKFYGKYMKFIKNLGYTSKEYDLFCQIAILNYQLYEVERKVDDDEWAQWDELGDWANPEKDIPDAIKVLKKKLVPLLEKKDSDESETGGQQGTLVEDASELFAAFANKRIGEELLDAVFTNIHSEYSSAIRELSRSLRPAIKDDDSKEDRERKKEQGELRAALLMDLTEVNEEDEDEEDDEGDDSQAMESDTEY